MKFISNKLTNFLELSKYPLHLTSNMDLKPIDFHCPFLPAKSFQHAQVILTLLIVCLMLALQAILTIL